MDILLAIPPRIEDDYGYTPAAAAVLKGNVVAHGFTAKVLDFNAEIDDLFQQQPNIANAVNNFFNFNTFYHQETWNVLEQLIVEWATRILSYNPRWVGLSVFSFNSQRATRLLSVQLKIQNPDVKIVIGGSGINTDKTFAETLYAKGIIDAYIKGDGEESLVELLKGNTEYHGINGTAPTQIRDLDALAYPDYTDYTLANYTNKKGLQALPITGSRGCVRNCTFCDINAAWPKFFYRSGASIASEIKHQVEKYGANAFRFTDSLTNGSMKAFREMCYELAEYRQSSAIKFQWDGHFIIRSRKQMPPEDFDAMRASGCGTVWIGIESGSERVRNHMKKGYTEADMQYTMEQLDRVGVKTRLLMIVGYVTETQEDFQETLDLFDEWLPYLHSGTIEEVQLGATLNLLPRTPLADHKDDFNIVQPTDHINDWICTDNPSLDYKERLRRRIIAQAHIERLGYPVFESKNYVKQMFSQWEQIQANSKKVGEPVAPLNY
jgi:hypothetical protein